jgi:hypothetical protein
MLRGYSRFGILSFSPHFSLRDILASSRRRHETYRDIFIRHNFPWTSWCTASELTIRPREIRLDVVGTRLEIEMDHESIISAFACFRGKTILVCPDMIHGNIMPASPQ